MFKFKSEFSRNVLTIMTGTTIAQALPVAISPILTRIYTPEDFGVFTLFVAISTILGSIANARYELAVMLPDSDVDAFNIAAIGVLIAIGLACVLLVIVVALNSRIAQALGNKDIGFWLYFVPISVFFMGLFNVLNYFNNRMKNYRDIANANIFKSLLFSIVTLSVGFIKSGASGLISGQIISNIFANMKLIRNTLSKVDYKKALSIQRMKTLAIRYQDFPKYSMWAVLANTLSQNLTNILISSYYSVGTLGFYSLGQRVLGLPTSLIGTSLSQVFFQAATKEKQATGTAIKTFDSTVKVLVLIAVPSFALLYFLVEDLFSLVFGETWRIAGTYAKILMPLFAVQFVMSSVSNINNVFEKQKIALLWQTILLTLSVGIVIIAKVNDLSFNNFLMFFSFVISIHYLFLYSIMRSISRGRL
jgi:O-antigen/teichoic acid export membrane protein